MSVSPLLRVGIVFLVAAIRYRIERLGVRSRCDRLMQGDGMTKRAQYENDSNKTAEVRKKSRNVMHGRTRSLPN